MFAGEPGHILTALTYTDQQLRWQPRNGTGLSNVFDLDPPVAYSAPATYCDSGYDIPGRFWHLSWRQSF